MSKRALITGVTGQDGSYLAELLLDKGYEVHGLRRRGSTSNTSRIDHLESYAGTSGGRFELHYGDLSDSSSLTQLVRAAEPDEIYNLAAQSDVAVSFRTPEHTADVDALGTLRLLEAIRLLGLENQTRFYQASTSELYGRAVETPQSETTPFYPRSPYAVAKLYAYWICVNYREAYGIYACNGILFNHESPRRGENFVTRKITRGMARIATNGGNALRLGNLNSLRDWGHARDYVHAKWLMLQQDQPEDFVVATGEQTSVRDFVRWAAEDVGIGLVFEGKGIDERAIASEVDSELAPGVAPGDVVVRVDPEFFRPSEVDSLVGNPAKAFAKLGWEPKTTAREMCTEMVAADIRATRRSC